MNASYTVFQILLLQTLAMIITAIIIPGLTVSGPLGAFIAVVAITLVNSYVWDAALFFHIPDSFTTHALLLLLANGVIFWIIVKLVPGIQVTGIFPALCAPVVLTITSYLILTYGKNIEWGKIYTYIVDHLAILKNYVSSGQATVKNPRR